jgi:hypothetical protein
MTRYEWDIETTDECGDIIDHHFADKLKDLSEIGGDLVLVKDNYYGSKSWAYFNDGIPTHFEDAFGRNAGKVPKRFIKEYEKVNKNYHKITS